MNAFVLRTLFAAAALATPSALVNAASAPSMTIEQRGPVTIVRQDDPHSTLVGISLILRAGLDRQTLSQNGLAALTAQTLLRTPVRFSSSGAPMPLEQAVAAAGGSLHFTVDSDDVRFYIEALAADAPQVVALVRQALLSPDFRPGTVRDARSELARAMIQGPQHAQYALQVGLDMLNEAVSNQANTGFPALGTATSLAQLVPADVARFYDTYYRSGGSIVSAAGRLDAVDAGAPAALAQALPQGITSAINVPVTDLRGSSREIVAHRDIAAPWLIAQYPAPSIDSRDFGPMLVLSAFMQRTLGEIAQVPGTVSPNLSSRAVGADYAYDRASPRLVLYVNGSIGNPTRAFATALSVVSMLSATRLQGALDDFKAAAAGQFATGATTLEARSWLAAVFARGNQSPDFLTRALRAISATTPQDVQRVARKYLGTPTIALVLPRDESPDN